MGFQLLVRDARTLTVDGLCAEDDAGTLIAAVERKAGVPCAKMWLSFAGKRLDPGMSLGACGLRAGATVHLAVRGRGGGAGASALGSTAARQSSPATLQWQDPEAIFASIDADKSGTIEKAELERAIVAAGYAEADASKLVGELDTDADGKISKDEWRKGFYSSSFVQVPHPAGETFEDLHHGAKGCIPIKETEERAITVTQLSDVRAHIKRRCANEGWLNFQAEALTDKTVTLYDAARYVIKPATYAKLCSYVELVAAGAQRPKWFCSHWWGEPVFDFVACIETHAMDHGYDDATAYWVCAYAPQLLSNPSLARAKGRS